jgi:hypothetical protein
MAIPPIHFSRIVQELLSAAYDILIRQHLSWYRAPNWNRGRRVANDRLNSHNFTGILFMIFEPIVIKSKVDLSIF